MMHLLFEMHIVMARSIRTTVSVPEELYAALAMAAESSHVSTAWVIRDALRQYLGAGRNAATTSAAESSRVKHDGKRAKAR
jgi:metal-responsive CopG/Arc/MetJ family transcriptional regulator